MIVPSFANGARPDMTNLVLWRWGPALPHYVEVFDLETLRPVKEAARGSHLALAVFFGKTRLIDNAAL